MRLVPVDEHSTAKFGHTHRIATIDERHHFYICSDAEAKELGHESNIRGERKIPGTFVELMGGSVKFTGTVGGDTYATVVTPTGFMHHFRW